MLISYPDPALSAALSVELEVMQTGETCPIENLNMGKLSCPPAVGWGGVRSLGGAEGGDRGKEGGRGKRYQNMTCLRIGSAKTIHSSGFPQLPAPSCISSVSTSPSPQIMLKAPFHSHDSLDV